MWEMKILWQTNWFYFFHLLASLEIWSPLWYWTKDLLEKKNSMLICQACLLWTFGTWSSPLLDMPLQCQSKFKIHHNHKYSSKTYNFRKGLGVFCICRGVTKHFIQLYMNWLPYFVIAFGASADCIICCLTLNRFHKISSTFHTVTYL